MNGFKRKKVEEFYQNNKAFLKWYLEKQDISGILHHLAICYFTECLECDIRVVHCLSEKEQHIWIMMRISEFLENNKRWR